MEDIATKHKSETFVIGGERFKPIYVVIACYGVDESGSITKGAVYCSECEHRRKQRCPEYAERGLSVEEDDLYEIRKKDELISKMVWVLREIIVAADSLNGIDDNASFAYQMRHSGLKVGHIRKTDRGHRIRRINIRPLKGYLVSTTPP
jgi:hypothetical protein